LSGTSRMRRESHVQICERLGVKFAYSAMGNGALAIGPKLPRPSSTLPSAT